MRILALCVVFAALLLQSGDGAVDVSAGICDKVGSDKCGKMSRKFGNAPETVAVVYRIPRHKDNVSAGFGLFCTNAEFPTPYRQLDGEQERVPQFIVFYRVELGGTCQAVIVLQRKDGSEYRARSEPVTLQERF